MVTHSLDTLLLPIPLSDYLRQFLNSGSAQERCRRQPQAKRFLHCSHKSRCGQRIAAEGEEVVLDGEVFPVQHLFPNGKKLERDEIKTLPARLSLVRR